MAEKDARESLQEHMLQQFKDAVRQVESVSILDEGASEPNVAKEMLAAAQKDGLAEKYRNVCNFCVQNERIDAIVGEQINTMVNNIKVLVNLYRGGSHVVVEIVPNTPEYLSQFTYSDEILQNHAFLCFNAWVLKKTASPQIPIQNVKVEDCGVIPFEQNTETTGHLVMSPAAFVPAS